MGGAETVFALLSLRPLRTLRLALYSLAFMGAA